MALKLGNDGTGSTDLLPVQFYIHGGGFVVFTNQYSGGDFFVHNDVIHVGFEYRLGVFGFLNLQNEIAPGNAGLKDQLAALQWVNRNIQRFGGDPEKVTIVGESAGSMSVHWLTLLPQTEGLFRAAIMKSGAAYDVYTDKPKYFGEQLIKNLSKITPGKSVEDLLLKSTPDQLIAASPPFVEEGPFRPTFISVEKRLVGTGLHLVTQDPESLVLQRVRSAVPMMIGVTSCEMAQSADAQYPYIMPNDPSFLMLVPGAVIPSKDTQRVLNISAEALGYNYEDVQSAIRNQFFKNFSADCDERCRFKQYIVQQGIKLSAIRALRHQAAFSSAPVYAYQYSYPASPNDECAYHGADDFKVWPIFANTSYNGTSPDSLLLRRLVKFISNFIKYMDPVPDMTDADIKLRWPSMKAASPDVYLNIGKELSLPGTDLLGSDGPFWTNLFKKYRDGKSF
ncbi:juvenile hormone esterase-like [Frankliniella occidentalis]|uniref:Carboxylic ester hydrolase n=1 Tax=Frankliniella occidentalis TaxID=133901 RepID=A0A9C6X630_FRAOC|nr:juvenile hormone esterase-like [Frankliniella occidentalis]